MCVCWVLLTVVDVVFNNNNFNTHKTRTDSPAPVPDDDKCRAIYVAYRSNRPITYNTLSLSDVDLFVRTKRMSTVIRELFVFWCVMREREARERGDKSKLTDNYRAKQ